MTLFKFFCPCCNESEFDLSQSTHPYPIVYEGSFCKNCDYQIEQEDIVKYSEYLKIVYSSLYH